MDTERRKVFVATSSRTTSLLAASDEGRPPCCRPLGLPGNNGRRRWQRRILKPAHMLLPGGSKAPGRGHGLLHLSSKGPDRSCRGHSTPICGEETQGQRGCGRGGGRPRARGTALLCRGAQARPLRSLHLRRDQIHRPRERPQRLRGEGDLVSHRSSRFKGGSA